MFELEQYDPGQEEDANVTLDLDVEGLNNDGHDDALVFQRWIEGSEGSRLRVMETRSGEII